MNQFAIRNILVPVSSLSGGEATLNQALYFQKLFSSRITLLQVIPDSTGIRKLLPNSKNDHLLREAHWNLIEVVKQRCNGIVPDFIRMETRYGNNTTEILKITKEAEIDFILVPHSEHSEEEVNENEMARMSRILTKTDCPVFFAPANWMLDGVRNILLPIEITRKSKRLVQWTMQLAAHFKASVQIVSVLNVKMNYKKSLAYRKAKLIKNWMINSGIACSFEIYTSEVQNLQEAVLHFSQSHQPDLVVAMPQQESMLAKNKANAIIPTLLNQLKTPVFSIAPPCESIFTDLLVAFKSHPFPQYSALKDEDQEIRLL